MTAENHSFAMMYRELRNAAPIAEQPENVMMQQVLMRLASGDSTMLYALWVIQAGAVERARMPDSLRQAVENLNAELARVHNSRHGAVAQRFFRTINESSRRLPPVQVETTEQLF